MQASRECYGLWLIPAIIFGILGFLIYAFLVPMGRGWLLASMVMFLYLMFFLIEFAYRWISTADVHSDKQDNSLPPVVLFMMALSLFIFHQAATSFVTALSLPPEGLPFIMQFYSGTGVVFGGVIGVLSIIIFLLELSYIKRWRKDAEEDAMRESMKITC